MLKSLLLAPALLSLSVSPSIQRHDNYVWDLTDAVILVDDVQSVGTLSDLPNSATELNNHIWYILSESAYFIHGSDTAFYLFPKGYYDLISDVSLLNGETYEYYPVPSSGNPHFLAVDSYELDVGVQIGDTDYYRFDDVISPSEYAAYDNCLYLFSVGEHIGMTILENGGSDDDIEAVYDYFDDHYTPTNVVGSIASGLPVVTNLAGALVNGFNELIVTSSGITGVASFAFILLGLGIAVGVSKKLFNWITGRHGM